MGRGCFCGCSNAMVVILNAGVMLTALLVLGLWATTASQVSTACNKFLQTPLLLLGVALLVVSLLGLIGACCRVSFFLWLYLATTFSLILCISCFTIFLFVVSNKGAAAAVSSQGVGGLRLGDYSGWLQRTVSDVGHWEKIESCLREARVCAGPLPGLPVDPSLIYMKALSPIQAGCCNEPKGCPPEALHGDCARWSAEPEARCFACDSCKAGVLANIQLEWKSLALSNLALISFLVVVYLFGCFALRSARQDRYSRYRRTQRPVSGFPTAVAQH